MADHTTEVLVGGAVLAAAAGFLFYTAQMTDTGSVVEGSVPYRASFSSVEGIALGTDVRLGGVWVGRVTDLELNPQTFRAELRFSVDESIALPEDTAALITSEGLLGGSFIELLPGSSPFDLAPGATIQDTQGAVSFVNLLLKLLSGGSEESG